MKKGEQTRQKLVDATAALLQRQGFHATGLSDIVAESGAPRGSIYFYFPDGKEALACAALEGAGERWREAIHALVGTSEDPGEAVETVCRFLGDGLAASKFTEGCPLATVGLEASGASERVRTTIARHYDAWIALIEARLAASGVQGEHASRLATFALSAIEGALLLAKVQHTSKPLYDVGAMLRALVGQIVPESAPPPARKGRRG